MTAHWPPEHLGASCNSHWTRPDCFFVQVSPLGLNFLPVSGGHSSTAQTLTLSNSSASAVHISAFSFSLPDYSETDNCQGYVGLNSSCSMQIVFSPQQLGSRAATMTIGFSGSVIAQAIALTGSGWAPSSGTPSSLAFGSPTPETSSEVQGVNIGNGAQPAAPRLRARHYRGFCDHAEYLPEIQFLDSRAVESLSHSQPKNAGPEQGALTISYPGIPEQSVVTLSGGAGPDRT